MRTLIGIVLLLAALLAAAGRMLSSDGHTVVFPTVSWLFRAPWSLGVQPWLGWVSVAVLLAAAGWLLRRRRFRFSPMTERKLRRFQSIGRGAWSLRLLLVLTLVACLDQIVAGKRALAVRHDGEWFFPAFREEIHPGTTFGRGEEQEADYREMARQARETGNGDLVIMPLIPWDPTFDTDEAVKIPLREEGGLLVRRNGNPYSGLALKYDPLLETRLRQARVRDGKLHLLEEVYDGEGALVRQVRWDHGRRLSEENLSEEAGGVDGREESGWMEVDYAPIAPTIERRHFLGTNSKGWDIAAQLYGGFQIVLQAAFIYLAVTYAIGITVGVLMGYLGGWFDIVVQRLVEILSSVPFLYVVIILVSIFERENITVGVIVGLLCIWSWIGCSYYMRTATYREKAREYTAAARVLGAGPGRIIFRHILPNTLAILVTLIPFSITSVSTSLTALDFIGFGIAEKYPSWGRLLGDGVEYLRTAPWIVTSVFAVLVMVLLLVTFVGEALREAFDPKQFTTYK